jgi:hypothetical protein
MEHVKNLVMADRMPIVCVVTLSSPSENAELFSVYEDEGP